VDRSFNSRFVLRFVHLSSLDSSQCVVFIVDRNLSDLDFWSCPLITDDGISRLSRKISHLRKLEHLSVNFWRACEIKQEGIESLRKTTARLPKLSKVQIYTPKFELLCIKEAEQVDNKRIYIKKFLQVNKDIITGNVYGFKNNLIWLLTVIMIILGICAFFG